MARSIWKSAIWFALIGPPVGAAFALCLLMASFVTYEFFKHDASVSLTENLLALLANAVIILAATYPIGGAGAFAAGATLAMLSLRAGVMASAAGAILVGAALSMLTAYGVDEYLLPHPHGDAAPAFGLSVWLLTGGVGGVPAAICRHFALRSPAGARRTRPSP